VTTPSGVLSLLTDFGPGSVYVGQMHAVIARVAPSVRVLDLAHDCPFGATDAAAYVLQRSYRHFPPSSVHVVVVDPGVGSRRAILAARAAGHLFVAPDNGVLGSVLRQDPRAEVRAVENRALMNDPVSPTFQGRDVLAPVAARLASGTPFEEVGPPARPTIAPPSLVVSAEATTGCVLLVDRFGNLITSIPRTELERFGPPEGVRVRIGAAFIDGLVRTFSDVSTGMALAYVGSGDHLEIAVNGGRASDVLRLSAGSPIRVERRR
jgi:S-adenosylmethionine hydrolase